MRRTWLDLCLNYESKVMGWWYHDMPQIPHINRWAATVLLPLWYFYGDVYALALIRCPHGAVDESPRADVRHKIDGFHVSAWSKVKKTVLILCSFAPQISDLFVFCPISKSSNSIWYSWQLEQLIIDLLVDIFPFKLYQSCCDFQRFIIIERFQPNKKNVF